MIAVLTRPRWIPGHDFPPVIFAALAVYLVSYFFSSQRTPTERIIADEIDIIATEITDRADAEDALDPELVDEQAEKEPLVELDTRERIVIEERGPERLKTLLTGLPSPQGGFWSALAITINVALALMTADLVYRAPLLHPAHGLSMARVGYVSDTTADVLIREPHANQYPVFLSYRYADSPVDIYQGHNTPDNSWKSAGSINWLDEDTDYTGAFHIKDLRPDTKYQYAVSTNQTGYFITAPRVGHTASRHQNVFTFLHSSCIKPHFPYNPIEHPLSIPGLRHLANLLPTLGAQFMVFLGDFIYVDVPHRFGTTKEVYRREYRQVYSSPDWPAVSKSLPWIHVLDDHEIANDWDRNTTGVYASAADPWHHYHVAANPPPVRPGATWFAFTQGPASFFMMDTRTHRDPFDGTDGSYSAEVLEENPGYRKSMLGEAQLSDLLSFLAKSEPHGVRWKIVVSSIPFTKNWRFGSEDTWGGYLGERQQILEAMWDVGARGGVGVVVLSGDRHEFAATSFPPPEEGRVEGLHDSDAGKGDSRGMLGGIGPKPVVAAEPKTKKWPRSAAVHEFSASPLSMFYLPVRTYKQTDDEDVCIK